MKAPYENGKECATRFSCDNSGPKVYYHILGYSRVYFQMIFCTEWYIFPERTSYTGICHKHKHTITDDPSILAPLVCRQKMSNRNKVTILLLFIAIIIASIFELVFHLPLELKHSKIGLCTREARKPMW